MKREITHHQLNGANNALKIHATDTLGAGGANHIYEVTGHPSDPLLIEFQNGPIAEKGVNGVTQEVLLAVVIDRLESFQAGPFPSKDNANALKHAKLALKALHNRTQERLKRGVEGQTKA